MNLKPEGNHVIVAADKPKEKTSGGIIVPEQAKDNIRYRMTKGTILAIGPAADLLFEKDRPAEVGDRVVYAKYGGFRFKDDDLQMNGGEVQILFDGDIIAQIVE